MLLYVDDGALIFNSRYDAKLSTNIYYNEIRRLGQTMHRGLDKKNSKIKEFYFRTRNKLQSWIKSHESDMINHQYFLPLMDPTRKKKENPLKKMKYVLDKSYDKANKTIDFEVEKDGGYISFTKNFRHLSSWISYDPYDHYDIDFRIKNACKAMGALKRFWNAIEVGTRSK